MSHENSESGRETPRNFVPEPFAYHEVVELEIDDITNLGAGVGRVGGWVVMVPFALGGERVRARIFRNRKIFPKATCWKSCGRAPTAPSPNARSSEPAGAANTSISNIRRSSNGSANRSATS